MELLAVRVGRFLARILHSATGFPELISDAPGPYRWACEGVTSPAAVEVDLGVDAGLNPLEVEVVELQQEMKKALGQNLQAAGA